MASENLVLTESSEGTALVILDLRSPNKPSAWLLNPPNKPPPLFNLLAPSVKLDFRFPLISKNPLFAWVLASENLVLTLSKDGIADFKPLKPPLNPPERAFPSPEVKLLSPPPANPLRESSILRLPILSKNFPETISDDMLLFATTWLKGVPIALVTLLSDALLSWPAIALGDIFLNPEVTLFIDNVSVVIWICSEAALDFVFKLSKASFVLTSCDCCWASDDTCSDCFFKLSIVAPEPDPSVGIVPPPGIAPPPVVVVVPCSVVPVLPAPSSPKFWPPVPSFVAPSVPSELFFWASGKSSAWSAFGP